MIEYFILILIFIFSCYFLKELWFGDLRHIPGPRGLPYFGNIFQMDASNPHIWLKGLKEKYGHIFKLKLLGANVVVVSGIDQFHEALVTRAQDFSGRPESFRSKSYRKAHQFSDYTPKVRQQKKIMMNYIKAYGSGMSEIERQILKVTNYMVEQLIKKDNKQVDVRDFLRDIMIRNIYSFQFHRDVTENELKLLRDITQHNERVFMVGGEGTLLDVFPWLRHFKYPLWMEIQHMMKLEMILYKDWKQKYDENKEDFKDSFMDTMMEFSKKHPELEIDDENICRDIMLFFIAGVSTTSVTLSSIINLLAHRPDLQEKLYEENKAVLNGRQISLSDRPSMPYHEATIQEASRYYSIVPISVPHKAIVDSEISGYGIPKGTEIWFNAYTYNHDPTIWKEPYEFDPSRFIDKDGSLITINRLTIFSGGSRVCSGEVLAKSRLFLLLGTLIQKFEIHPATTIAEQASCDVRDAIADFFLHPGHFKITIKARK